MRCAAAFLLFACAPTCIAIAAQPERVIPASPSQQEANKAVARRVLDEILSQGRFQVANEIYAPDFVNHGLHHDADLKEDQAAAQWEKRACPDLKVTADLMAADGDLVTVVWRLQGTNTRAVGWLPATGVHIELKGITVWRIVSGRIHDEWTSFDRFRIVRQIAIQLKWQLMAIVCVLAAAAIFLFMGLRRLIVVFFRRR